MVTCGCLNICVTSHLSIHLLIDDFSMSIDIKPYEARKAYTYTLRTVWVYQNNSGAVPPLPVRGLLLQHSLETRGRCHRSCSLFHFLECLILNQTTQSAVREGTGEELACIRVVVVEVNLV